MSFVHHSQRSPSGPADDPPRTPGFKRKKSFASVFRRGADEETPVLTTPPELPPIRPYSTIHMASVLSPAPFSPEEAQCADSLPAGKEHTDRFLPGEVKSSMDWASSVEVEDKVSLIQRCFRRWRQRQQGGKKANEDTEWDEPSVSVTTSSQFVTNCGLAATNRAWVESPAPEHVDENGNRIVLFPEHDEKKENSSFFKRLKKVCSKSQLGDSKPSTEDTPPMPNTSFLTSPGASGELYHARASIQTSSSQGVAQDRMRSLTGSTAVSNNTSRGSNNASTAVASPNSSLNFSSPSFIRGRNISDATIPDVKGETGLQNQRNFSQQKAPAVAPTDHQSNAINVQRTWESIRDRSSFSTEAASPSVSSPDLSDAARKKWRSSILLAADGLEAALGDEVQPVTKEKEKELFVQAASQAISTMRASDAWMSPNDMLPLEARTLEEFGQEIYGLATAKGSQREARMAKLQAPSFQSKIMNMFKRKHAVKKPNLVGAARSRTTTPTLFVREHGTPSSNAVFRAAASTPSDFTPSDSIRSASGFTPSGSISSGSTVVSRNDRYEAQSFATPGQDEPMQAQDGLGISLLHVPAPPEDEVAPPSTTIAKIKVNRDSRIVDRFVVKRDAAFFTQLEHEKQTRIKQLQERKDSKVSDMDVHSPFLGRLQGLGPRDTDPDSPASAAHDSPQSPIHPALRTPALPTSGTQISATTMQTSGYSDLGNEGECSSAADSSGHEDDDRSATPTPRDYSSKNADTGDSPSSSGSSSYSDLSQYEDEAAPTGNDDTDPGTPREDSPTLPPHMAPIIRRPAPEQNVSTVVPTTPEPSQPATKGEVVSESPGTPSSASKPFWQHILEKSGPYKQVYGKVANEASSTDAVTVSDISQSPSERWSTRALRRQKFESAIYDQQTGGGGLHLPGDSDTRSLVSSIGSPSSINVSVLDNSEQATAPTNSPSPAQPLPSALKTAGKTGFSPTAPPEVPARSQFRLPVSPSPLRVEKMRMTPELPPNFSPSNFTLPPSPLQFSSTSARSTSTPGISSTPLRFPGKGSSPEPSPSPLRVGNMGLRSASELKESPSPLHVRKSRSTRMMSAGDSTSIELDNLKSPFGQMRKNMDARRAQQQETPSRKVRFAEPESPAIGHKNDMVGAQIDEILASKEMQPSKPKIGDQMLQAAPSTITPFAGVMSDYQDVRRQSLMPKPVFGEPTVPEPAPRLEPFADVSDEYQYIRRRLQLMLLKAPIAGEPKHPNHDFRWASTNVKCKDKHMKARIATDSSVVSPLVGSFPDPDEQNDGIEMCHSCGKACCHFANQVVVCNSTDDQSMKKLASNSVMFLRGAHPTGFEPWSVLMDCTRCNNIFCPNCGTMEDGKPVCRICLPSTP